MTAVDGSVFKTAVGVVSLGWRIELFFRLIEQLLGCRHLLSTQPAGVEIQMYLAIIACLRILIYTGGQPNKRTYGMICFYLLGWASWEELEAHIEKLKQKSAEGHCAPTAANWFGALTAGRLKPSKHTKSDLECLCRLSDFR